MKNKLIEIKNLRTQFYTEAGTVKAVDNVSFDILVGESGSGKSVTSLSINRLIPNPPGEIVSGEIIYKKQNLLNLSYEEMRNIRGRDIAMIFQEPMTSLNPVLKIGKQMNEVLIKHEGLLEDEATKRSIEMLEAVGIPEPKQRITEYPHQFSGGMRQRVMIAMALQCNPSLLIADEPTTALDVTIQAQILDLMMDLKNKRQEAAILLITHDLAVVAETCDRVIVMYGGEIQEIADVNELFKNPLHPYTKALMKSIPHMDIKTKRLTALRGMVPSILDMGNECKFCNRFDSEECPCKGTKLNYDLFEAKPNHFVRCNKEHING